MKYWLKVQLEPDLLGPGLFCYYSWFAHYKIESKVHPPPIGDITCLSFYLTSFKIIRSRKMQQRSIWSDLPTFLLPRAQKVLGCALDCICNWGSSPFLCYPKRTTTVLCASVPYNLPHQEKQCIGNTTTSIPAAFPNIQFSSKEFCSFTSTALREIDIFIVLL